MLVIHPDECIDCALCEPECPVDAIFSEDEIPQGQEDFLDINAELAEIWPNIVGKEGSAAGRSRVARRAGQAGIPGTIAPSDSSANVVFQRVQRR